MKLQKATLVRLNHQHKNISFLIQGLAFEHLEIRLIPNKWSIKEHLAHLGRYQEVFKQRVLQILNDKTPKLDRYIAEYDEYFQHWLSLGSLEIMQRLGKERQALIELLKSLNSKELNRLGKHPKLGKMDIPKWTEFFLLHEAHHQYTIFRMTQELLKKNRT